MAILDKKDIGKEFEDEVKDFLEYKLGFSDVKGGPTFHIAPNGGKNQIDACGRYKDILFVFECKAAGRKIKKSLRKDILATKEKARMVMDGYKNVPEYSRCKFVKFIFITKKIVVSEPERNLFKETYFWYSDENLLEYYSDLSDKIGEYAIFNFLADYGILPPKNEHLSVTATKAKLGNNTVYSFFVYPNDLLKFSYVARRRSLNEDFYQRMLDKTRIKKIRNFIESGGVFPTNIILSLKGGAVSFFESDSNTNIGTLRVSGSYSACWIIDGQHRLYSFAKSNSNTLVPCIAFEKIDIEDERRFFLEINREQKPIQADLIWDLEGLSNPESYRGIISNIVRTLNNREPFLDKIYIPAKGTSAGKIVSMTAFCNGIVNSSLAKRTSPNCLGIENPLFTEIARTMTNRISSVLERYFKNLEEELDDLHKPFIFGNAGIPIMLYLLEPIVARIGRIPGYNDLSIYSQLIADFFSEVYTDIDLLKKLKAETTSEASRKNVAKEIGLYIRKENNDKNFWPKMEQNEFVQNIIDMERLIARFISNKLSEASTAWQTQRIPQEIYKNAKNRMEQDGTSFDENLSLGDELQIILRKDNWTELFKDVFINESGFMNQDEMNLAFKYLSKIRNPGAHGKTVIFQKDDLLQCKIYLDKFSVIIPEGL